MRKLIFAALLLLSSRFVQASCSTHGTSFNCECNTGSEYNCNNKADCESQCGGASNVSGYSGN